MKIGVLVKRVPDTEFKVKISGGGDAIDTGSAKWIVNPYDEYAIEEALQLKKATKGEVVIITMGPKKADETIRSGLAMGADRGIRIDDAGFEGTDADGVAACLAAAIKKEEFDLIFAGKQAIDGQQVQVPQLVAEHLDWPQATSVEKFDVAGDFKSAKAQRAIGGGSVEVTDVQFPAVISAEKGLNKPRFASLPNIMKAKRKKIALMTASDLGVDVSILGADGARLRETHYSLPPARSEGRIIDGGDLQSTAALLVKALREEAKVI